MIDKTKGQPKDYSNRARVKKYMPWWVKAMAEQGPKACREYLMYTNGRKTKYLNYKDRVGLMQALGLQVPQVKEEADDGQDLD